MIKYEFEYLPRFRYLCVQNCVVQVMNHLGYTNAGKYIDCSFECQIKLAVDEQSSVEFIYKNMNDLMIEPLRNNIKIYSVIPARNAWNINKTILDNGDIYIAIVDVYYMFYRKEYKKNHGAHAVIVVGYNEREGWVEIFDCYGFYNFNGKIPYEDYFLARNSQNVKNNNPYSGWPIYNKWIEVSNTVQKLPEEECLYYNLKKSLAAMKETKEEEANVYNGTAAFSIILTLAQEKNTGVIFWKKFYEWLFTLSRSCELLLTNMAECNIFCKVERETIKYYMEFNNTLQKLLFLVLKMSIKENEKLRESICDVLNKVIIELSMIFEQFQRFCDDFRNVEI